MPVVHFLRSNAGRLLKVAAGVWLLAAGMTVATLGGLVMMMTGVFVAVTGLAGICFTDGVRRGRQDRRRHTRTAATPDREGAHHGQDSLSARRL